MAGGNGGTGYPSNGGNGGGIGSDGSGQPGDDAGRNGKGGGGGGGSGRSGIDGDGGGGGGGGNAGLTGSFTATAPIVGQDGGNGADGTGGGVDAAGGGGGGGGGGGAGGYGYFYATGTPSPQTINEAVTGGTGGNGGSGGFTGVPYVYFFSSGGNGGDGGAGVLFAGAGSVTIEAAVTGGNGGAGGSGPNNGQQGLGGAGASGSGISITLAAGGSITGGTGRNGQADSIDFTGGANTLDLGKGTLSGNVGVDNTGTTLNFVQTSAATLANAITGAGAVIDSGGGTLTLSGQNTYTGRTTVENGMLLVDGSTAASSAVIVGQNAILGGAGTVGGTVDVADSILSPSAVGYGSSGPNGSPGTGPSYGTLTTGALTLEQTAALQEEIGGTTAGSYDRVAVQGTAQLAGALILSSVSGSAYGDSFTILTASGGLTGKFGNAPNGTDLTANGRTFRVAYANGGGATPGSVTLTDVTATPGMPTVTAPANGADTNSRTITGTTTAGDTVQVTITPTGGGAATTGAATVTGDTWSYTPTTPLADGQYTATATQTAPGDAPSTASMPDTFTIDTTAPAAPSTPADAAVVNGHENAVSDTSTQTITGTTEVGSKVEIFNGDADLGAATVDGSGNYSFTPGHLADGSYSITAQATDASNNTGSQSAALAFTVDTVPPTITAVADGGPGIDANGNGDLNAGKAVTLTVTTSEPVYVQGGQPTLTLNDGGTATYTGGSGTAQQTFSYTVAAGQNTAKLAVTAVNANGATVTDAAGNPLNPGLMSAAVPSGTLTIDTTPPVASSPTLRVAQNAPATPIGIAAPSDNLTAAGSLAIVAGTLPNDGRVTLADGTTAVTVGQALTAAQLTGLEFTPTPGLSNQGSTFTYTVTDGAGNASTGTAALNVGAAGAPTITGTHATVDGSEAAVAPFSGVTVSDPNMGTNTLTITLQNGGGTLTGTGLVANANGTYTLAGSAATVTQQLDALSFTPAAPPPGTSATTTFVLSDVTAAGTSVADVSTSVTDTASAPPPPPPNPTPDAISISPQVSYSHGVFTLTGSASSAVGVAGVEISAVLNDGTRQDLGAATVDANGNFNFADRIGAHQQGFIEATLTDGSGVQTTSADPGFSLTGGLNEGGTKARQTRYSADGMSETAVDLFKADGSQKATVLEPGQTFTSSFFDTFHNGGAPDTTFVFNPGFGRDVVNLFRVDGVDHDTLSFKGSDYGNDIATVLASAKNTKAGLLITDPTASSPGGGHGTHDTLLLKGITKQQLAANQGDIAFHA